MNRSWLDGATPCLGVLVAKEIDALWHHRAKRAVDLEIRRYPLPHEHLVGSDVVSHHVKGEHAPVVRFHAEREMGRAELHRQDGGGDDEADRVIDARHQHEDP